MAVRRFALGMLILTVILGGCQLAAPPVRKTPAPPTPTPPPTVPTATPLPWPKGRFLFSHLGKVWLAEDAPPYAITYGEAPALSPDGGRIAYLLPVTHTSPARLVYVLNLADGTIALVSGPPAAYHPPAWSPDGQALAYTYDSVLVVTDPTGTLQRVLCTDVGALGEGPIVPAWSSDSQTLVCPLTRLGPPELFAVRVTDGAGVQLSYTGGYSASLPFLVLTHDTAVAPKDSLVYVNNRDGGTLWAAPLDGSGRQRVLITLDHVVGLLRLSPDGKRLAGLRQAPESAGYELWVANLTSGQIQKGETLPDLPEQMQWDADGRTLYWVSDGRLYGYAPGAGGPFLLPLPAPTPTPSPTPLQVDYPLIYYSQGTFFRTRAYAEPEHYKDLPTSLASASGFSLHQGVVAFSLGPDLYVLRLEGGSPRRIYSFQQEGLVRLAVAWSLQGNALLYTATYEQKDAPFGRRVDVGILYLKPYTWEVTDVRRLTSLPDRSLALPLLYDEERREAVLLPYSGSALFTRLEVYSATGEVREFLPVEGYGTAALSPDRRQAAATGYDEESGRYFLRFYALAGGTSPRTLTLPPGTTVQEPLVWSADGRYLALILLVSEGGLSKPQGLWVVQASTLESSQVSPLDRPALLVGWGE
ncbi:MAG: TolB family protein [Chloroflexia bacterium]